MTAVTVHEGQCACLVIRCWNSHPVWPDQLRIWHFSLQPDVLIRWFVPGLRQKGQLVLMVQMVAEIRQKWLIGQWCMHSLKIRLAAGFIRKLGKIALRNVAPPETVGRMPAGRSIDRKDPDVVSLSNRNGVLEICVRGTVLKPIDAAGDHQ